MEEQGNSPSSSTDSSSYPSLSSTSFSQPTGSELSTDLQLGLGLATSSHHDSSFSARSTLMEKPNCQQPSTFFIKVYMEGVPIGRKLDLFSVDGYESLIKTLRCMFRTNIIYHGVVAQVPSIKAHADPCVVAQVPSRKAHVLTYEDQEGDWMMVGDVPWEMFLTTVKRLKITRPDKC